MFTFLGCRLKKRSQHADLGDEIVGAIRASALWVMLLEAHELTIMSCTCKFANAAASENYLWKALWRKRYDSILWSVPKNLRNVDETHRSISCPMAALHSCLKDLKVPPCWWDRQLPDYSEQVACFEKRLVPGRSWKAFYFAFGAHWQKFAVAPHNSEQDLWLAIHGEIFDMTAFDDHPGRCEPFLQFAGMDATEAFEAMGHSWDLKVRSYGKQLIVSSLSLQKEGNLIRPAWLLKQEAVPVPKVWLYKLFMFDVRCQISYHDFWYRENHSNSADGNKLHLSSGSYVLLLVGGVAFLGYACSVAALVWYSIFRERQLFAHLMTADSLPPLSSTLS
eukprot:TRINITY_DN96098_c0_g1_i1.p1 TRINITY_DN96098_c0_g1~~TRINITY_DN96098_c0_g1_i1.p1  ORF type:complete len:335 (-),score=52.21 TRINITY_DN96098_c0_g1_i1:27-1031(-)